MLGIPEYDEPMKMLTILFFLASCTKVTEELADSSSGPCENELTCFAPEGVDSCIDCDATCQRDYLPSFDRRHLEGAVDYANLDAVEHTYGDPIYPPAAGPHYRCWWDWGVWEEEVPVERWVHNMEHGGVVFLYNCPEGCAEEVAALVEAVGARDRVIVSPYANMEWRFAAVAWEHRTLTQCLDVDHMVRFYTDRVGKGPEDVASMAPSGCMDDEEDSGTSKDTGDSEDTGNSADTVSSN